MLLNHESMLPEFVILVVSFIMHQNLGNPKTQVNNVEKLHLDFCKQDMGVKKSTFNADV